MTLTAQTIVTLLGGAFALGLVLGYTQGLVVHYIRGMFR